MGNIKFALIEKNMDRYGFVRFHYPGEEKLTDNVWLRKIETGFTAAGTNEHIEIPLTSQQLIPLGSGDDKIVMQSGFSMQSGLQTIDNIHFLSQRAGWNQTLHDVETLVRINPAASFIACFREKDSNIVLGSGMVLQAAEQLSWIGMILVHQELRRQGVARMLMQQCIACAGLDKKTEVIGLDATGMGKPLYSSLGFKASFRIWRSKLSTRAQPLHKKNMFLERPNDIRSISDYLAQRSIADKKKLLEVLLNLNKEGCQVLKDDTKIVGIVFSRPGRLKPFIGPLITDSVDHAKLLLNSVLQYWQKKGCDSVFMDIPEYHFVGKGQWDSKNKCWSAPKACVLDKDIQPLRMFDRMYLILNDKDIENPANIKIHGTANSKLNDVYKKALKLIFEKSSATEAYMSNEKKKILPYMFCTGGPEIS